MKTAELYEKDFYRWAIRNADLLSSGEFAEADIAHIAEEVRDMGSRERRELLSRLRVLTAHLLKWQAQPERQSFGWRATSLRQLVEDALPTAYRRAVEMAAAETGFPDPGSRRNALSR
jgi:hypothetical protein